MSNGMDLVRQDRRLIANMERSIKPFIPPSRRGEIGPIMFLRCAAHQLEGKDFKPESLVPALLTFAMAGILPNSFVGHGYLVVFKGVVTPIYGYRGLIELASRVPDRALLQASGTPVLNGDVWHGDIPLEDAALRHVRGDHNPRSGWDKLRYAYARFRYARNIGGIIHDYDVVEVMTRAELQAARDSARYQKMYSEWPLRMAVKAPIRRMCASGKVPLSYAGSLAVGIEGQASTGQTARYLASVQAEAGEHDTQTADFVSDAIDATMRGVDGENVPPVDKYASRAAALHRRLREGQLGANELAQIRGALSMLRVECGLPDDFIDEILNDAVLAG